ncbi:hypothetical protein ACFFR3_08255 [Nonomuraea salmonea]|uniref:DUF1648 domain-containing protein n=1 Tax=Nonomuraea salmonea TaxID=46181 RepID=A0ABV5NGT8_9ACTN
MKDYAAQGRLRRLAIAVLGPLPMFLVPVLLVATMGDELPERVRVHGWSFATRVEFTWQAWSAQPVWGLLVWVEALSVLAFLSFWHVPWGQRVVAALGVVTGSVIPVAWGLWALGLTATLGGAAAPGLPLVVKVAGYAAAFGLGWWLAGALPRHPEADGPVSPWVRVRPIGAAERVMFVTSLWSWRRVVVGGLMLVGVVWLATRGLDWPWLGFLVLVVLGVFEASQAWCRLQVDAGGVSVALPWLRVRRSVPWGWVRYAEVGDRVPKGRYKWDDSSWGWGAVGGRGPVLVVWLADGRRLVFSTPEAETGAALVNGWLERLRGSRSC